MMSLVIQSEKLCKDFGPLQALDSLSIAST
jgi:hypothetical protein